MASVFEYIGIKKSSDSTPIPQLGIDNPLSTLQLKSKTYFAIEALAEAADGNKLGIKVAKDFALDNAQHVEFVKEAINAVKAASSRLKITDLKITGSVIVGVVASSLSFFPLLGVLGAAGWGSALYHMHQRATDYAEYKEALTLLVATCNWCLGKKGENDAQKLSMHEDIRAMMAQLYPLLTEKQVRHLIDDDIENIFVEELKEYEQKFAQGFNPSRFFKNKDDQIALSKRSTEFNRCLYGFNKGHVSDFCDALFSALPDLYRMIVHGVQRLHYWVQEKMAPKSEEQPSLQLK